MFGGRFDPPHRMHLAIARQALDQLGLAELHWVVSGLAPHKPSVASPLDRLAMVRCVLAQENDPRMLANDFEVKASREGRLSYTIDTLRALAAARPQHRLVLIIGSDQAWHFDTWKDWKEILGMVDLAVVDRPGIFSNDFVEKCQSRGTSVTRLEMVADPISATEIRASFLASKMVPDGVIESVALYARKHRLYETATQPGTL